MLWNWNLKQSNRAACAFESTLHACAINVSRSDDQNTFATISAQSGHPETSAIRPLSGAKQTTLESKPERAPGGAPLRPVPGVRPLSPGAALLGDSTLVACYRSIYAPRAGGAYDSHHWTAGIVGRAQRRGGCVA